ncbi:hypothetical protein VPHD260_0209 [Vibrio phage D260]
MTTNPQRTSVKQYTYFHNLTLQRWLVVADLQ